MADFPKVDRLKSQLITSGLQGKDPALFQIINTLIDFVRQGFNTTTEIVATSGGGGSASAIDALTTDVVATGPGTVAATIQPNAVTTPKIIDEAVTYAKIQDTTLADILIGRALTPGPVQEIELGANLQIIGNTLEITTSGGGSGGGLAHNLLSATHPDTVPASPIEGDLVYAAAGIVPVGTYVNALVVAPIVEDFEGCYVYGTLGMGGGLIPSNCGAYGRIELDFITPPLLEVWPTPDIYDAFVLSLLVEDFSGIRAAYNALVPGQTVPGPGNSGGYAAYPLAFVAPTSPTPTTTQGIWRRLPIATDGQVLTIVDGVPDWENLPPIPDEPAYPWIDIPFNAADFTATGGTTPAWTVASGDVARWQYQQLPGTVGGDANVRIALYIKNSTVSGTGPTQLQIQLPFNIVGEFALFISMRENSLSVTNVALFYDDGVSTNELFIEKVPSSGTFDTTANETYLSFEISATLG